MNPAPSNIPRSISAAIEHIDRVVLDQTRGQRSFRAARDLLDLDRRPAEALLLVEFFSGAADRLETLARLSLGRRTLICADSKARELVWASESACEWEWAYEWE